MSVMDVQVDRHLRVPTASINSQVPCFLHTASRDNKKITKGRINK